MAKILVTGGCGYIGSHTIVDLIENGFEVVSIDNLSNSYLSSLDNILKITGKKITNYQLDVCDLDSIEKVFQENEFVGIIHFAALKAVNESVNEPLKYYRNNILGLLNILECCAKFNIENFVFSSSCSVYGNAKTLPVTENTPLAQAESPYAETKVIAEKIIKDFNKINNTKFSVLRYFNPIGAHMSGKLGENAIGDSQNIIPRLLGVLSGKYEAFNVWGTDYLTRDGSCIRDYVHVSDIANGHTLSLKWLFNQKEKTLEVFNMGSGDGTSVIELIAAFEKGTEQKLNHKFSLRREGDVAEIYANNDKTRKVLDWYAKISLEDTMRSIWKWEQNK